MSHTPVVWRFVIVSPNIKAYNKLVMPRHTGRKGSKLNRTFSQKFWEDKQGHFVVWQMPNVWLWTWAITLFLSWFAPYGFFQKTLGWVSLIALVIWAFREAVNGVNYFRRSIGVLVLVLLILVRII
jgi:hypothetical protein